MAILVMAFNYTAHGEYIMRPIYTLNKASMKTLEPKTYSTKKMKIEGLFDVPIDNMVATNRIGNAITLISFKGDKVKFKTLKRNFLDYVSSGDDGYMFLFSEDTIGYTIGRGFLLFNVKNNKSNYYSIAGGFNYDIGQTRALDPEKKIFIFNIRDRSEKEPAFLRIMDLNGDTAKTIIEKDVGNCGIAVRDKIIFVWKKNIMYAMNDKLEEINHPLTTIFNKEKPQDYGTTVEVRIHPKLPFAIIRENKYDADSNYTTSVWAISWRECDLKSDKPKMIKILAEDSFGYLFSYDGKWLLFSDLSSSPDNLIIMPVDPDLPYFIGKPIYLGQIPKGIGGDAMTRNPSGFVMAGCEGYEKDCWLKKWDFTEAEKLIEKPIGGENVEKK
jgi:hypothetical protein